VIVGDDRQLSAVGPGGALHALLAEHPEVVTVLTENKRQTDPTEAAALLHLRSGHLDHAINWYATHHRITVTPDRIEALTGIVNAYVDDVEAGHDTLMLAWQRRNVADLNRLARDAARQHGWLQGPDLETPDGRLFAVGDQVVMLAPNYEGQLVTSERAHIIAIDRHTEAVTIETEHGRHVTLTGPELDPDRIDYGYALTIHREQGATSDRTHYYADGGGRELAYVAASRARHHTTIHTVADDHDQAIDRLRDDWSRQQHDTWLTPAARPGHDPQRTAAQEPRYVTRARLQAELAATLAQAPPNLTKELTTALARLHALQDQRKHLLAGTGPYERTAAGQAIRQLRQVAVDLAAAQAARDTARIWDRRRWDKTITNLAAQEAVYKDIWDRQGAPLARRLDQQIQAAEHTTTDLQRRQDHHHTWHRLHPEHTRRVRWLQQALTAIEGGGAASGWYAIEEAGTARPGETDLEAAVRLLAEADTHLDRRPPPAPPQDIEPPSAASDLGLGL
jgi:hypothetical protein